MFVDKNDYVSCITRQEGKFDVIVIDGQWRNACAAISGAYLNRGGMIIFDNSDRHYNGCDLLREKGFFQIDFSGFSPINRYASTTSLLLEMPLDQRMGYSQSTPVGSLSERTCDED